MSLNEALEAIEEYFESNCNGSWEHHAGISIESTDNPGWVITFIALQIENKDLHDIVESVLKSFDAQVQNDGKSLRVFAPKLSSCLSASGTILSHLKRTAI